MDYLCLEFEGVLVDTKVIREYNLKNNITDLIDRRVSINLIFLY